MHLKRQNNKFSKLLQIGRWTNAVYNTIRKPPPGTRCLPQPLGLYPSLHPSVVCTGCAWSAWRTTPVHVRPPILPVKLTAHQKIAATSSLRSPLMHQRSRPKWAKPSRRPKKPPWTSSRTPPRSYFTQTHWHSHPESSQEEPSGPPYRRVPTPPMQPQCPLRPLPPTPPHWRLSGAAK